MKMLKIIYFYIIIKIFKCMLHLNNITYVELIEYFWQHLAPMTIGYFWLQNFVHLLIKT